MTAEMVFLHRPLFFKPKNILGNMPLSNTDVIRITQDFAKHEDPLDSEFVPVDICDDI